MVDTDAFGEDEVVIERATGVDRHFLRSISSVQECSRRGGALCSELRVHPAVLKVCSIAM
jgi:hypothetical protein